MKDFLTAVQFLTRWPMPGRVGSSEMSRSMIYFPVVGLLLGLVLVIENFCLGFFLPRFVVDTLLIISLVLLTGALHLDGLADTLDGFYAGQSKEDILRIMRDSNLGTMGVVGLICLLGLKLVALWHIPGRESAMVLLIMPMTSRWMMVLSGAISNYARAGGGLGEAFSNQITTKDFAVASIVPVIFILACLRFKGLIVIFLVIALTWLLTNYIKMKINGVTGDTLGAVGEIVEAMVIVFILALA